MHHDWGYYWVFVHCISSSPDTSLDRQQPDDLHSRSPPIGPIWDNSRGHGHVKGGRIPQHVLPQALPLALVIDVQADDPQLGAPLAELGHPIGQNAQWYDDKVRAVHVAVVLEVGEERDGLEGLAQTLCARDVLLGEDKHFGPVRRPDINPKDRGA